VIAVLMQGLVLVTPGGEQRTGNTPSPLGKPTDSGISRKLGGNWGYPRGQRIGNSGKDG